jgi:hypothetical protein
MRKSFLFLMLIGFMAHHTAHSQAYYHEDPNDDYFKAGTLLFGAHWNKFDALFSEMSYDVFDQSGAYDFSGKLFADSTKFVGRSTFFGLGFNINGIQFLMSGSFRRTSQSNFYQLGFGAGFNHIIHFSDKTGQPLVWFEGLINYNFLKHNTRLRYYEITQPPMAIIDGTQFPDIGFVADGNYRLNVEFNRHMIEPVAAMNFALTKGIGLRFAAGYSFFLNSNNADLYLKYKPLSDDNSGAKPASMAFNRNIDNISVDGAQLSGNHLDLRKWNFNISLVFRMIGDADAMPTNPTNFY